jgi:hypothetical protein
MLPNQPNHNETALLPTRLPLPGRLPAGREVRRGDGWLGLETAEAVATTVRPARVQKEG